MNVVVVGTGYVGLVTGVCLADAGHHVTCVDNQDARVATLNKLEVPFFEPGLGDLLKRTTEKRAFRATNNLAAVADAEIILVAVGTPSVDGRIELTMLETALSTIGAELAQFDDFKTVVIKSTVLPGTTDTFARGILERASGKVAGRDFGLAMNPEFLREGSAVEDFASPDRVVIGAFDEKSADVVERLYASYGCAKIRTTPRNAELIKYASNAILATLISFSNEIATICESVEGLDADIVMDGVRADKRWSPTIGGARIQPQILSYLRAGSGFGGSCLPKDVAALVSFGADAAIKMPLLQAVLDINTVRPGILLSILRRELGELRGRRIVLLGLSFKAGTDDLRASPGLRVADLLLREGANVSGIDPLALALSGASIDPSITLGEDASLLTGADAAVLTTAWPQFREWSWSDIVARMRTPIIVDGRNALRHIHWPETSRYRPIGTLPLRVLEAQSIG